MTSIPRLLNIAQLIAKQNNLADVKFIGNGAFKETYRVTTSDNTYLALKLCDLSKCSLQRSEREINSLLKCHTSLICKLHKFGRFFDSGVDVSYSMEEFLGGGTLSTRLINGPLPIENVKELAINLIMAIGYLREINVVHRDIKPDNIMFRENDNTPVLVDLGIARDLSETSLTPTWASRGAGTPLFSAPEQLNNDKALIDWRTDQYSLGIVIGLCIVGQHPFGIEGATNPQIVEAMTQRRKCPNIFNEMVSEIGLGNMAKMLEPWPIRRFQTIGTLLDLFGGT